MSWVIEDLISLKSYPGKVKGLPAKWLVMENYLAKMIKCELHLPTWWCHQSFFMERKPL